MIEIPVRQGSDRVFKIDDRLIHWSGQQIVIDYVSAISYVFEGARGYVSYQGGYIDLHTPTSMTRISAGTYSIMGFGHRSDNMREILAAVLKVLGSRIFTRVAKLIFEEDSPVTIGSVQFSRRGITSRPMVGPERLVPWSFRPRMGYGEMWTDWFSSFTIIGETGILFTDPGTGKQTTLARVMPKEKNGFLVPFLIEFGKDNWKKFS